MIYFLITSWRVSIDYQKQWKPLSDWPEVKVVWRWSNNTLYLSESDECKNGTFLIRLTALELSQTCFMTVRLIIFKITFLNHCIYIVVDKLLSKVCIKFNCFASKFQNLIFHRNLYFSVVLRHFHNYFFRFYEIILIALPINLIWLILHW